MSTTSDFDPRQSDPRPTTDQVSTRSAPNPHGTDPTIPDKHGRVVITVDGVQYHVKPGTTNVANLAKHATLATPPAPPTMAHVTELHTKTNQKFRAGDNVDIQGGEVFTSGPTGKWPGQTTEELR